MNLKSILSITVAVVLILVIAFSIWLSRFDKEYDVRKSIVIDKPISETFNYVLDFRNWAAWSPWLIMEKNAEIIISTNSTNAKSYYTWKGKLVGEGKLTHKQIVANKQIDQELSFKKPFPSTSKVYWKFNRYQDNTNQTIVTWGMIGSMPFLFRFMTTQIRTFIGMDYERGLRMLKDKIETGKIDSIVNVIGKVKKSQIFYIGIKGKGNITNIGNQMSENFKKLKNIIRQDNLNENTNFFPFTIYHEFDFYNNQVIYTTALPLKKNESRNGDKDDFYFDNISASSYLKILHRGDYKHLGNAWSTAESYLRSYKIKKNKKKSPLEFYLTDPEKITNKNEWLTEIYFSIKD